MIAIKGGTIPEAGILAAALLFVSGSMGSTAAIHFVFSPYVYKIEEIPIRFCSTIPTNSTSPCASTVNDNSDTSKSATNSESDNSDIINNVSSVETTTMQKRAKDTLLKAWTRTLFLQYDTTIFDPTIDVQPYKGLRPMCNFVAKGRPLYVHPGKSLMTRALKRI
jgi:hypothetical protein